VKKILISQRFTSHKDYFEEREELDMRWGKFISACGMLPIPLLSQANLNDYIEEIKPAGILITGGNDLASISSNPLDERRDKFEIKLIELAKNKDIPLLGVCRGLQLISSYFGNSLDVVENHVGNKHAVEFVDGSLFSEVYGKSAEVNSYHNYGVAKNENADIIECGKSQDGQVEAIAIKSKSIYAIMWHPEREKSFSEKDINLFIKIFGDYQ